jgi:hypothetical protein
MSRVILWQNLSPAEIRKVIREWPVPESKSQVLAQKAQECKLPLVDVKVKQSKPSDFKGLPKAQRQKHVGADGEVKFVAHRDLWLGFFGGRAVVKARTQNACAALLKKHFDIDMLKAQA